MDAERLQGFKLWLYKLREKSSIEDYQKTRKFV